MNQQGSCFYIVTGGPGSGKSSIVEALHQQGYARSIEAGRGVIQGQMAIGGRALPWSDRLLFAELMLSWEIRSHQVAEQHDGPVFFDRGIPDVLGYLRLLELIAPPWREIYSQDRERKQDFDEAIRTFESMVATYTTLDYQLIKIPCTPVGERVSFILDHLSSPREWVR